MKQIQCIITGCELIGPSGAALRGDLYKIGDVYVFNGVVYKGGGAAWRYEVWEQPSSLGRWVRYVGINFFEKRGVVVMHESEVELSEAAIRYIETGN